MPIISILAQVSTVTVFYCAKGADQVCKFVFLVRLYEK